MFRQQKKKKYIPSIKKKKKKLQDIFVLTFFFSSNFLEAEKKIGADFQESNGRCRSNWAQS